MSNFKTFLISALTILLTIVQISASAQCYSPPAYCTNITATNVGGYGMGIQNVSMGSINNTTPSGSGSPIYFDYTNMSTAGTPSFSQPFKVTVGNGNQTTYKIYIDWNNDGVFNTTAPELCYTSPTKVANSIDSNNFSVPASQPAGSYRMRFASDYTTAPGPCGPLVYSAEFEDYTYVVTSATPDASVFSVISPTILAASPTNNTAAFSIVNHTNTNMTSVSAGYSVNGGTPVTQTFTGLNIAPGASYTVTFSTGFTVATIGNYNLKYWLYGVNGSGTQNTPSNDTICKTFPLVCTGVLAGNYTINPSLPLSVSNFQSFTQAALALQSCGISAAVNFAVSPGTYVDTLYVKNISGVSAVNTITFDGGNGNKATRILTFPTSSIANAVVRFDKSRYVTVRNLTVRSTGVQGWAVHFMNDSNDRINNCNIEFTGPATSSTSNIFAAVVINNSYTNATTQSPNCRNITVDSNSISYGYYGIASCVSNGNYTNYFRNNSLQNQYYLGMYFNGNQVYKVTNNIINMSPSGAINSIGINPINANANSPWIIEISGNKIYNAGQYGILSQTSSGGAGNRGLIYNNFIGGGFRSSPSYGINSTSANFNIYHNNINMDFNSTSGNMTAFYQSAAGGGNDVRNNNFVISANASIGSYPVFISNSTLVSTLDYNNYINNSTPGNLVYINGSTYSQLNYLNAYPNGGGINSYNNNPNYTSNIDLHTTAVCNHGANLTAIVPTDIDGQTRNSVPDIGADEVITIPNNDIGVSSITTPNFPLSSGAQTVTVVIKNYGANTITSANIGFRLGNGAPTIEPWTGSLAPCATATYTFTANVTITAGSNNFKAFTNSPNGNADVNLTNDTTQWTLCPSMNGVYTINPSGSGSTNFTSFTAAVGALTCGGVSGPVTFNVSDATYNEQVVLPFINGSSFVNTIKFQSLSGNAANCIINFSPTTNLPTIDLNSADYISFNKFTIKNNYNSTAYGVYFRNGADYNTLSNCIVTMLPGNLNAYGIFQSNTTDNKNTIIGNTVNNGYIGIYFSGNSSVYSNRNIISNNNVSNSYYSGIFSQYQDSVIISGNTITSNSANTQFYGIYAYWSQKGPILTKNKVAFTSTSTSSGSYYGIYGSFFNVNSSNPTRGLIANNMIQVGGTMGTAYGLYMVNNANYIDIVHNSVNMTNSSVNNSYALYMSNGFNNDTIRNNIFQNIGNGINSGYAAYVYSGTNMYYNNNDFFTKGSNCGYYNNTIQTTYASWKAACTAGIPGFEANGLSSEVTFNSISDLHTTTACIADLGFNYSASSPSMTKILDDFDGQARSSTPDLGCDEFAANAYDIAMQTIVSPNLPNYQLATPYTVKVRVRNNGSTTITSINMNYSINGTVTSQVFTGLNLLSCDTTTLTFTVPLTLTTSGTNVFKIFNGLLNTSNTDLNNANDTIISNFCTPYSGTYTINKLLPFSSTNFASINQAVGAMYSCGMSGPVKLRIASGTGPYIEQVVFNGVVTGSNATNTLTISGNTSKEIVEFNPTSSSNQHVFRLNATKHIILDSLTINNTGTSFGIGVHITGTSDSNRVLNSIFNNSISSTSFSNSSGVSISSLSASANGSGNNGNDNTISNNIFNGGYYGTVAIGTNTTTFCKRNNFTNNTYKNQAYYGLYAQYQELSKYNGNTIDNMNNGNPSSAAMYCNYVEQFQIQKNKINNAGQFGMSLNNMNYMGGTGIVRAEISNNMIGGTFFNANPYGMYISNQGRNIDIWHNSIHVNNLGSGNAFYIQYQTTGFYEGLDMRNNTISATNNTSYVSWCYWNQTGLTPSVPFINFLNNNIFSYSPSTVLAVFSQNGYFTTGWISASTNGLNTSSCKYLNPQFLNEANNLHINQTNLNDIGTNIAQVTTDIDGDSRPISPSSTVDIGADEYNVPALNIGPVSILAPVAPISIGLQDVVVQIKNFGTTTVTSANVSYKVGVNGAIKTIAWTGSLANNATTNVTFTGSNQYNFTGSYDTVITWTDGPNGSADQYILNDTLVYGPVCKPLAGNYTINPSLPVSATNFQSFTQLAIGLNNCGMTAAVNVSVAPNTYLENIAIGNVAGNDTIKSITIDGGNSAVTFLRRKIIDNITNFVVRLDKTKSITFKNLSIQNDSLNIGTVIQATGGDKLKFNNCVLEFSGAAAAGTSNSNKIIQVSNTYIPTSTVSTFYNSIEIDSCTLNNGYNAFDASFTNYTCQVFIRNCKFNNQYYCGLYSTSNGTFKILNNTFSMRSNASYSTILIFNSNPNAAAYYSQINGNKFFKTGQNAIYTSSTKGGINNTRRGEMYNNMIGGAFMSTGTNYAMQINYSDFWDIYHNSISMDSVKATSNTRGIYINANTISQTTKIKNNSISITDNNAANPICVEIFNSANIDNAAGLDYNNYYNSKNGQVLLVGSVPYDSFNYKVAYINGAGANSKYGNPKHISRYDLHTKAPQLDNWGAMLGVLKDVDDENRSLGIPDVGADEFFPTLVKDISAHSLLEPTVQPCFGGSSYVLKARYQNSGTDSILLTSTDTVYTYILAKDPNNVSTLFGPIKHTNQLIKRDSFLTSTFSPAYGMSVYGTYTFKVYCTWNGDTYGYNDSIIINRNVTNPKPILSPISKVVFCSNDSTRLSAGSSGYGAFFQWVKNGSDITGEADSFMWAKTSGKYYCKVTSAAGCTLLTDSVTLTVNPAPTATITSDKTAFCPGDSVKFSCTFAPNMSYQWLLNNTVITGATDSVYYAKSGGDFTIRVTNNTTSCYNFSNNIFITAKVAPTAIISPNISAICNGDSMTMSTLLDPNYVYQWLLNANPIIGSNSDTIRAKNAGTYTVFVVDTFVKCATLSGPAILNVNPNPTAVIASVSQSIFCNGDSALLSATTVPGVTYQWFKNGAPISGATDSVYYAKTSGDYQVKTVFIATGCKSTSSISTITVKPTPMANTFYFGPSVFCAPDSHRIYVDTTGGTGNTYQWRKNGTDISGATNFDYFISSTGSYSIEVTRNGCEGYSTPKSIVVGTVPNATISSISQSSFCFGDSSILKANTAPGFNYQWYNNGIVMIGATDSILVVKATGNYAVKITEASSGCNATSTSTYIALVSSNFAFINYNGPLGFCFGGSLNLEADTVLGSNNIYQWMKNGVDISGATNFNYTVTTSGSYQVKVRKNSCISISTAKNIFIETDIDTTMTIIGNINGCAGSITQLKVASYPNFSYFWYKNGFLVGNNTPTLTLNTSGNYTVKMQSLVTGCNKTSSVVVVNYAPTVISPIILPATITNKCAGDSILLSLSNIDLNATQYKWYKNGTLIPGATSPTYMVNTSGDYSAKVLTANNCEANSTSSKLIAFNNSPLPVLASDKPNACEGDSVIISLASDNGISNRIWYKDNVVIPGVTGSSYSTKQTGTFKITVTDINNCVGTSLPTTFTIFPNPNPTIAQNGANNELNSSIATGNQWYFNNVALVGAKNQNYGPRTAGNYHTIVTDANGCAWKSNVLNVSLLVSGISKIEGANILVSPNPSNGIFHIAMDAIISEHTNYEVKDVQGKVLSHGKMSNTTSIDLQNFATGTYYLEFKNGNETQTIKLIKE